MSLIEDQELPPSTRSALQTIGRISRTAEEFTRRRIGFGQRLIRAPLVPDHQRGVHAQIISSSDTTRSVAYSPYTRFKPRGGIREDSPVPTSSINQGEAPLDGVPYIIHSPQASQTPNVADICQPSPPSGSPLSSGGSYADDSRYSSSSSRPPRGRAHVIGDENSCRSRNARSLSPCEHSQGLPAQRSTLCSPISHSLIQSTTVTGCPLAYSSVPMDTSDSPSIPCDVLVTTSGGTSLQSGFHVSSPLVTGGLPPADADLAQSSPPSGHSAPSPMSTSSLLDPLIIPPPVPVPVISYRGTSLPTDCPVSMNTDPIPSEGCSSLPTGDGTSIPSPLRDPSRPVPLPVALGAVIDQAITDRLDSATAGLVEPTVRGIVDACLPHLTELIESRFAILATSQCSGRGAPCKERHPEPRGYDSDDDGDGDGEYAAVPQRRKKPGPRGKMNRLHKALRDYLRQKKIIPSGSKCELPPSALADAVLAFNQDGASPPSLENIALDWSCWPLTSSRWNSEAIAIVTLDFYSNLKSGAYQGVIFDEHTMNLPAIRKICEQKLVRTHQSHRKQSQINLSCGDERVQVVAHFAAKEEKHRKADRMTARRHGTFARRQKIVMQNRSRDLEKWDAIHKIIDRLGVEGMSGDETDSPPFSRPKVLRRLELPWINPGISYLFKSVETYESALRTENMLEQIGNSSLKRHWEAGRKEVKSTTIPGLPRNWYDDNWFQGLATGTRLMLSVRKDVDIPTLEPYL